MLRIFSFVSFRPVFMKRIKRKEPSSPKSPKQKREIKKPIKLETKLEPFDPIKSETPSNFNVKYEQPLSSKSPKSKRVVKKTSKLDPTEFQIPSNSNDDIEDIGNNKLPKNISEHIKWISKMRENGDAPVDTMGCHMLADKDADPKVIFVKNYFIIISNLTTYIKLSFQNVK